jgi:hypothetical protein
VRIDVVDGAGRVHRFAPFTIRLIDREQEDCPLHPVRLKLDSGTIPAAKPRACAVVTTNKKVGTYLGRVAIRASSSFNIQAATGLVQGIHHRFCTLLQRADGYGYSLTRVALKKGCENRAAHRRRAIPPGL